MQQSYCLISIYWQCGDNCSPLASSIFAPTIPAVLHDFHSTSETLSSFVVSVYLLGFCVGPILFAPLSELYGRQIIYHFGNIGFLIFTIACGESTSMNMLIVFRFFAGCFGCAPLTIGGGSIADLVGMNYFLSKTYNFEQKLTSTCRTWAKRQIHGALRYGSPNWPSKYIKIAKLDSSPKVTNIYIGDWSHHWWLPRSSKRSMLHNHYFNFRSC